MLQDKGAVDADCVVLVRGAQNVQCMMFMSIVHCSDCYVAMQALIYSCVLHDLANPLLLADNVMLQHSRGCF